MTAIALMGLWATAATADIPPAPLGLDVYGSEYALISNDGWRVSTDGGTTFTKAKAVSVVREAAPGAIGAFDRQRLAYIWAPACKASKQTLIFRRTFFLPGPATTLSAQLYDTTHGSAPANSAITSVKIYFNGTLAISAPGAYVSLQNKPRAQLAGLLKFGSNTIDVVVVKRAKQGSYGKCFNNYTPPQPLGVMFQIYGDFAADAWITKSSDIEQIYERATSTTSQLLIVGTKPKNLGPSGIYSGKLVVEVSGGEITVSPSTHPPTVSGGGLRNCTLTQAGPFKAHLECEVFRMRAGDTPVVQFPAIVTFASNFSDTQFVYLFRTFQTWTDDLDLQSNMRRTYLWLCHPDTTNPKCP